MTTYPHNDAMRDAMEIATLPVGDGSNLVLVGTTPDEYPTDASSGAPILGPVTDFLQQLAVGGAIMGITGNASYDVLRMLRLQLQQRRILTQKPAVGIDDVRERVADALTRAGHPGATFTEVARQADKGWDIRGAVAAGAFTARADPDGQVFQYRIL